jgi:hypothetical protein
LQGKADNLIILPLLSSVIKQCRTLSEKKLSKCGVAITEKKEKYSENKI